MTYKYVCVGMVKPENAGKVFWFHDDCAQKMGIVAGGNPERTDETPPNRTKCYSCGKEIFDLLIEQIMLWWEDDLTNAQRTFLMKGYVWSGTVDERHKKLREMYEEYKTRPNPHLTMKDVFGDKGSRSDKK